MSVSDYIRWFGDLSAADVASVGGKTASLGELYCALSQHHVKVPEGFAITAQAYRDALDRGGRMGALAPPARWPRQERSRVLAERAAAARQIVYAATGGEPLRRQIMAAYRDLNKKCGGDCRSPSAARRRPRTCRPRASRASTRAI